MMKVYINNKKNSNLHLHQPFNKRIWLMKRERTHRILHHFSFGERFDETMMNAYCVGNKYIAYTNHQFIGFLSTNKPAGKVAEVKITIRRPDGRMSDLQGKAHCIGAKKETADNIPTLPQAFKEQKSHSLLGHFLHAVPCTAKNAPISQRGCTPLDTPACHAA